MDHSVLIGSIGVSLLLLAFILNLFKLIQSDSFIYSLMNFTGASVAGYASILINFIPFVILEFFWAFIGLVGVGLYGIEQFTDQELIMPFMATNLLPAWLAGIAISGAIAAMMSTADSQLLVTTSAISEDIYHQMIRKDAHVNDSFYVCPSYNELILQQAKIGTYTIPRDAYFSLATPQGVQTYEDFLKSSTYKGRDEDSKT